jgi:hypothetical protein
MESVFLTILPSNPRKGCHYKEVLLMFWLIQIDNKDEGIFSIRVMWETPH